MDAVICSTDAEVSSTLDACSVDACDSDCAVADISSEALVSVSAEERTSPTTCDSRSVIVPIACSSMPASSREVAVTRAVRSPSAMRLATDAASPMGRVIESVTHTPAMSASSAAIPAPPSIILLAFR